MVCKCPPYMCYYRHDCRRGRPQPAQAATPRRTVHEAETLWLHQRREALEADLARDSGWWTPSQYRALQSALKLINQALARREPRNPKED
jgi:hypothetical protein